MPRWWYRVHARARAGALETRRINCARARAHLHKVQKRADHSRSARGLKCARTAQPPQPPPPPLGGACERVFAVCPSCSVGRARALTHTHRIRCYWRVRAGRHNSVSLCLFARGRGGLATAWRDAQQIRERSARARSTNRSYLRSVSTGRLSCPANSCDE